MTTTTAQRLVDETMDEFDYNKVQSVMENLNWYWATIGGIPSVADLKKRTRELLYESIEWVLKHRSSYHTATGGFTIDVEWDDDEFKIGGVELKFILEYSRVYN